VLLATKLHVPRLQPGFVPRPRLAEALSDGLAYRLIPGVRPGRGCGTTVMLGRLDPVRPAARGLAVAGCW
jgi:ATP/maltotriose-dependent transcriptional regulator MalT